MSATREVAYSDLDPDFTLEVGENMWVSILVRGHVTATVEFAQSSTQAPKTREALRNLKEVMKQERIGL